MRIGSVHGRFQPFHNGHLKYVLAAQAQCDFLWIGITMCDLGYYPLNTSTGTREEPHNNPLTFFERVGIITDALLENGIDRSRFGFLPFPIENPDKLPQFLSTSVPCYTTVCEPWNEQKIEKLRALGYEVITLYREQPKTISGSVIRNLIANGEMSWTSMVPSATIKAVKLLGLRNRLITLRSERNGAK